MNDEYRFLGGGKYLSKACVFCQEVLGDSLYLAYIPAAVVNLVRSKINPELRPVVSESYQWMLADQ